MPVQYMTLTQLRTLVGPGDVRDKLDDWQNWAPGMELSAQGYGRVETGVSPPTLTLYRSSHTRTTYAFVTLDGVVFAASLGEHDETFDTLALVAEAAPVDASTRLTAIGQAVVNQGLAATSLEATQKAARLGFLLMGLADAWE